METTNIWLEKYLDTTTKILAHTISINPTQFRYLAILAATVPYQFDWICWMEWLNLNKN